MIRMWGGVGEDKDELHVCGLSSGVIAKHYPLINFFLNSYYLSEIIRRI